MEKLVEKLKEILEVEELDMNSKFTDYEEWDSLSALSIIAMLNTDYHIQMKNADIQKFATVGEFVNTVLNQSK